MPKKPAPRKLFHAIVICGVSMTACGGEIDPGPSGNVDSGPALKDASHSKDGNAWVFPDGDLPDGYLPPTDGGADDVVVVIVPPPPIH